MPPDTTSPGSKGAKEIRVHGRGGQGGVTCAKILASVYSTLGKSVQTFGDYAGERSGAPVRAYTRISDQAITNRNKVYNPDELVVLDPSLLKGDVVSGLVPGGLLLLNTSKPIESYEGKFDEFRLATVDATEIARRHKIGTRSVVIVNTSIAGAYARLLGVTLEHLEKTYKSLGLASNFPAAKDAYEAVAVREPTKQVDPDAAPPPAPPRPEIPPLPEHFESPPTGLKTGSWSSQRPIYVEKIAPCNAWCPAGNDVVRFIQTLLKDGVDAAAANLASTNPLPGVCGRVCPAPCEQGCNRLEKDGAVQIRLLERWVADHGNATPVVAKNDNPRRVAIIGSGPAGLTAAYFLALAGHKATIFEGEQKLGGILRTGIPTYRLPRDVVDREVERILALGVEARTGEFVTAARVEALAEEFDAVIIATGLRRLRDLRIEGAGIKGVTQGVEFLGRMSRGEEVKLSGQVVVVLGGGFTAMDCARSALRAGAERVTVAYRRTFDEILASPHELEEAQAEGIEFLLQSQPVAFLGKTKIEGIEMAEVVMGEPDESGRRRPVVTDRRTRIDCDHVVMALGQSADTSVLPAGWTLADEQVQIAGQDGKVFAAGDIAAFEEAAIFAAGDLATWEGTVAAAIGNGRRVADLTRRVFGEDVQVFELPDKNDAVAVTDIRLEHFEGREPASEPIVPVETRLKNYSEVNQGLVEAQATTEAERCFSCGHCTKCDTCLVYCPEGIIRRTTKAYAANFSYCKGCGVCVEECARSAMEMREI